MGRESGDILRLTKECEASARRLLKKAGLQREPRRPFEYPATEHGSSPSEWKDTLLVALDPVAGSCFDVLRLADAVRREVRRNNADAAALSAFRLGQLVLRLALRDLPGDALRGAKILEASRCGAAESAGKLRFGPERVARILRVARDLRAHNPYLSFTDLSRKVAKRCKCGARTVRRYLRREPQF